MIIIEAIIRKLNPQDRIVITDEIYEYFITNGIGWQIENGQIETRGDEVFEVVIKTVVSICSRSSPITNC